MYFDSTIFVCKRMIKITIRLTSIETVVKIWKSQIYGDEKPGYSEQGS